MTTSEVEALAKVAVEAWKVEAGVEWANDAWRRVAEAVARAVRTQDAARGGVMTVEQVAVRFAVVRRLACCAEVAELEAHAAAQGRANAALEERVAGLESALRSIIYVDCCGPVTGIGPRAHAAAAKVLHGDATPSEHPDTTTLRAIRERATNLSELIDAFDAGAATGHRISAVVAYLLGDSGPSGGGECVNCDGAFPKHCGHCEPTTPPDVAASERKCSECGTPIATHPENDDCALAQEARGREAKPTREEDWRTVEETLRYIGNCRCMGCDTNPEWFIGGKCGACSAGAALSVLARLRDEPRRAAEAMRENAINSILPSGTYSGQEVIDLLRALPL